MKFKTLNGKEVRLNVIADHYPVRSRATSKSEGQFNLGRQIQSIYGLAAVILEEFPIPDERLFLDFYLPHHTLVFEFQGTQHDTFNKFFHLNKDGFKRSQERDSRKAEWCQVNNIVLVEIRDPNLSSGSLKDLIMDARK